MKPRNVWPGFWLGLIGLLPALAAGAEVYDYARAQADPATVNLGDELVYTVEVSTAGEKSYSPDIVLPDLTNFQMGEIFSRSSVNILNGRTHIISFKEVHLTANRTGQLNIAPSRIEVIDPDTRQSFIQETNQVMVAVNEASGKTVRATPTPVIQVLRPIKKSAHLSLSQVLPFAVGFLLMGAIYWGIYFLQHRPAASARPVAPAEPPDQRTPEQRALDSLAEAEKLRAAGQINPFFTALSALLRRYIAEEFNFKAEEATTRELLDEMRLLKFTSAFLDKIGEYFKECDQVKFADARPDMKKIETAVNEAKDLIVFNEKREKPVEVAAAAVGAEISAPANNPETTSSEPAEAPGPSVQ